MTHELDFYATPGRITEPGAMAPLLAELACDIPSLVHQIQGLLIHVFWADQYGVEHDDERRDELQLRAVEKQLQRIRELDPRPLPEAREPSCRLVGNCRDFSTMLTAVLRYQGVPARARCGFAAYFMPNHYEDHWVSEYWNAAEGRWVLVDAQLDELQQRKLGLDFDPLDVPRDQFITGGRAWQMARAEGADPDAFGIHDMHGLWFIRGNLVRDVAALNKMELLPWDVWGLAIVAGGDEAVRAADLTSLDEMAALSSGDVPDFDRLNALYETDPRWRVPRTIRSFTGPEPVSVDLGIE